MEEEQVLVYTVLINHHFAIVYVSICRCLTNFCFISVIKYPFFSLKNVDFRFNLSPLVLEAQLCGPRDF